MHNSELELLNAANYNGEWSALVGYLGVTQIPSYTSVSHDNKIWFLLNDLADVTLSEPGVTADWRLGGFDNFDDFDSARRAKNNSQLSRLFDYKF